MWLANQFSLTGQNVPFFSSIIQDLQVNTQGQFIDITRDSTGLPIYQNTWLRFYNGDNFIYQLIDRSDNGVILFSPGI